MLFARQRFERLVGVDAPGSTTPRTNNISLFSIPTAFKTKMLKRSVVEAANGGTRRVYAPCPSADTRRRVSKSNLPTMRRLRWSSVAMRRVRSMARALCRVSNGLAEAPPACLPDMCETCVQTCARTCVQTCVEMYAQTCS